MVKTEKVRVMGRLMMRVLIKCVLNCSLSKSIIPRILESLGLQAWGEVVVGWACLSNDFSVVEASQKSCLISPWGCLDWSCQSLWLEVELPQLSASRVFSLSWAPEAQYVLNWFFKKKCIILNSACYARIRSIEKNERGLSCCKVFYFFF